MERFRPKTYRFSDLCVAEGENTEEYVSMQAATAQRTAKRRPGRRPGAAMLAKMQDAVVMVTQDLNSGADPTWIAWKLKVPVEVILEFQRSL